MEKKSQKVVKNKWLDDMRSLESAADMEFDPTAPENCLSSQSPYLNWISGQASHGFPNTSSVLWYGEPKSGKSFLSLSYISKLHQEDPEAIAVYVSTELRGRLQAGTFPGIDQSRILIIDSNDPVEISDELIDANLKPKVAEGMPLKILVIDSITGIQGIKRKNADTIEQHLIGDSALTIGNFLGNVVPWCKRNKIFLMGTAQMRANIDSNPHAAKTKLAASFSVRHSFEHFVSVARANAAEDKVDIEGKTFEEEGMKDARGNGLLNGHKIYVKMEGNSIGPAGRSGVFTLDYTKGIVDQHSEIFHLGKNCGIITTTNNRTYEFQGQKWNGKKETALAIRDNPELAQAILKEVKKLDE